MLLNPDKTIPLNGVIKITDKLLHQKNVNYVLFD